MYPPNSKIENDKIDPQYSTIEKIAKVLDVPMIEFFKEDNAEANSYDKNILEKVKLIEELDEPQKNHCSLLLIPLSLING